jgi:hypothetical protein
MFKTLFDTPDKSVLRQSIQGGPSTIFTVYAVYLEHPLLVRAIC